MNSRTDEIIFKRMQTTMIGALSEMEKAFGYLWGYHKSESEPLTDKEEKFLDIWEETRNRILNNGNNQIRKAISEIKQHNGQIKYNYKFTKREGQ